MAAALEKHLLLVAFGSGPPSDPNPSSAKGRRFVAHRPSFMEIVVPHGDPNEPHYRKKAFDAGEDRLGKNAHSLKRGCDCLGYIKYFDAHYDRIDFTLLPYGCFNYLPTMDIQPSVCEMDLKENGNVIASEAILNRIVAKL